MRGLLREGGCTMRVDGPYGEAVHAPEWTKYRTLVVIAGGIGVRAHTRTPGSPSWAPRHAWCHPRSPGQQQCTCCPRAEPGKQAFRKREGSWGPSRRSV